MFPRTLGVFVALVLVACALRADEPLPCHEEMAELDGVWAYSNGEYHQKPISCGGATAFGYAYQCVEFIERYYSLALGVDTSGWVANGGQYFGKAQEFGLEAYKNGKTSEPPRKGNILDFEFGEDIGHAAIVVEFDRVEMAIEIIEQNWSLDGLDRLPIEQTSDGYWYMPPRGHSTPYRVLYWFSRNRTQVGWGLRRAVASQRRSQ